MTGEYFLGGTACSPLELVITDGGWTKDFTGVTLSFGTSAPVGVLKYTGSIVSQDPFIIPADAVAIDLSDGAGQYQTTDGTSSAAVIADCSNAVNGLVFEVLGSGGIYPSTIVNNTKFVMANGTTWTASAGAKIIFKVFKDGASTFKYIEQYRE